MTAQTRSTYELARDECLRLLADEEVGRLGFVVRGRAEVLPVNYVMDGEAIVFRTGDGTKLRAASNAPVTFEVDAIDRERRSGWSVVVRGVAHEVASLGRVELSERLAKIELAPWGGDDKPFVVRVAPIMVTGRWVGPGWANGPRRRSASTPFDLPIPSFVEDE